jgi:hypothetical protein
VGNLIGCCFSSALLKIQGRHITTELRLFQSGQPEKSNQQFFSHRAPTFIYLNSKKAVIVISAQRFLTTTLVDGA